MRDSSADVDEVHVDLIVTRIQTFLMTGSRKVEGKGGLF
jgi:hypothetical protein